MALLKTNPDEAVMKKYLEKEHLMPIIKNHLHLLPQDFSSISSFTSKRIHLLSAQSYLVKYDLLLVHKNGATSSLVLRGNRISQDAADFWQYLHDKSNEESRTVVPIPWEYFAKDNFMLYQEFPGKTLRDYDDKFKEMLSVTPKIAKHLAWIHSLPPAKNINHHTGKAEAEYWDSVKKKIEEHLPNKPEWLDGLLSTVSNELMTRLSSQQFTLCHNDFQASNLIFDERENRIGVIDFGNSTIYTPSIDIATYLVHTSVMTTKHLTNEQIEKLQKVFLERYLEKIPTKLKKQVLEELPLYEARAAADIIATTAVALGHTQNPYRILIPKMLLPVLKQKMELLARKDRVLKDLIVHLEK